MCGTTAVADVLLRSANGHAAHHAAVEEDGGVFVCTRRLASAALTLLERRRFVELRKPSRDPAAGAAWVGMVMAWVHRAAASAT